MLILWIVAVILFGVATWLHRFTAGRQSPDIRLVVSPSSVICVPHTWKGITVPKWLSDFPPVRWVRGLFEDVLSPFSYLKMLTGSAVVGTSILLALYKDLLSGLSVAVIGVLVEQFALAYESRRRGTRVLSASGGALEGSDGPDMLRYSGLASLPGEAYVATTRRISVELSSMATLLAGCEAGAVAHAVSDEHARVDVQVQAERGESWLEIELQAPGIEVTGESKQTRKIGDDKLSFTWVCNFNKSGILMLALEFRHVTPYGSVDLGRIDHLMRVVQLDHMTSTQVDNLKLFVGSGGLIAALALVINLLKPSP